MFLYLHTYGKTDWRSVKKQKKNQPDFSTARAIKSGIFSLARVSFQ